MTATLETYLDEVAWLPATFTRPLSEEFISDGPKLRRFCELFWKTEDGKPFKLDDWQAWLIDHALERYPKNHPDPYKAGRLRYREVVISVARQNGKSVFAAIFGLYGLLMHEAGPTVIGLASNADQANIIYRRVRHVIDSDPDLKAMFKTTGTRGISRLDEPGLYQVKPAKADALQGIPVTLCLFDEVHLCDPDMWQAMVKGTTAQDDGLVLGITTAGDDNSILLKSLYSHGRRAAAGSPDLERFGFFCWEAEEGLAVDDPKAILAANPAVVAGRLPLQRLIDQVRTEPLEKAQRFTHNLFTSGAGAAWLDGLSWAQMATGGLPDGTRPVFTITKAPNWSHATITAAAKVNGQLYTELVADFDKPSVEQLANVCKALAGSDPIVYVMGDYGLDDLAEVLQSEGFQVKTMRAGDMHNASEAVYAMLTKSLVSHDGNARVSMQMPRGVRKYNAERWRIVPSGTSVHIDMVLATVYGLYVADTFKEYGGGVY